jgi:hypothetical protein
MFTLHPRYNIPPPGRRNGGDGITGIEDLLDPTRALTG